ncbi:MAG: DUF4007 family protein [Sphingomonas bacterium]
MTADLDISGLEGLRFSGHETFACRYAWLSKAYRALLADPHQFADEEGAMIELGIGRNMVRSLRFWVEAMGLANVRKGEGLVLTDFAHALFARDGLDPYLEDVRSLWLLHWNLSSRSEAPLFAWRYLLNHWPFPELTRSEVLAAFLRESARLGFSHSEVTLAQHLDIFLHSYHPSRGSTGVEDSLDGPLVELALIQPVGERRTESGRFETVYAFRREPKADITPALFAYCIADYWTRFRPQEETLTLREIASAPSSPGQVFKLPEDDVRSRLELYANAKSDAPFSFVPSAIQGLLSRPVGGHRPTLRDIYEKALIHA